jgi:hypothetical protein
MTSLPGAGLSTPEGLILARELLRPQLPHDIHDHILEGICKALDGFHVLAVIKTGGGKTGYFYGYILLLRALQQLSPPSSLLKRNYPQNPVMVIVFPTKGLEEEMVRRVSFFSLSFFLTTKL